MVNVLDIYLIREMTMKNRSYFSVGLILFSYWGSLAMAQDYVFKWDCSNARRSVAYWSFSYCGKTFDSTDYGVYTIRALGGNLQRLEIAFDPGSNHWDGPVPKGAQLQGSVTANTDDLNISMGGFIYVTVPYFGQDASENSGPGATNLRLNFGGLNQIDGYNSGVMCAGVHPYDFRCPMYGEGLPYSFNLRCEYTAGWSNEQ
jgi:hypothetical protein